MFEKAGELLSDILVIIFDNVVSGQPLEGDNSFKRKEIFTQAWLMKEILRWRRWGKLNHESRYHNASDPNTADFLDYKTYSYF